MVLYHVTKKINYMITKQKFDLAAKEIQENFSSELPKMIRIKKNVQTKILDIASSREINDVILCRINQGMIDKLCRLAKSECGTPISYKTLYAAAMAVATIVKEYDWGTQYLVGDGLFEIAQRIERA